jgi:hypothetical protein
MEVDLKSATATQRKAEFKRLAQVTGDDQFFTRRELNHLPDVLASGERVIAFCSGLMDASTWLITLTDRRIIFLDKGLLYGLKQISINLEKINAVTGTTRLVFGSIQIEDGAQNRVIDNVPKRTVVPFSNAVRDAIERMKQRPATAPPLPSGSAMQGDDVISKLERLGVLRASGVLTVEEFSEQKARVLASA